MAWIYLAASEEIPSDSENMSKPLLTVKQTDTLNLSSYHEWATEVWSSLRSGMTSKPLTEPNSKERSISLSEGSPAKISALLEMERAWKASEADYFLRSCAWSGKSTQRLYSLRTSPQSGLEVLEPSSNLWPSSGMTVDGLCYQLRKSERLTKDSVGSCLLPTPTASTYGSNKGGAAGRTGINRPSLESMARKNLWPTPTVQDACGRTHHNQKNGGIILSLLGSVTTEDGKTPKAGGALNPTWVEWLMGFPLEWTALSDLGTQWFRSKQKQRSKNY